MNPFWLCALVCEQHGHHAKGLEYAQAAKNSEFKTAGHAQPIMHCLAGITYGCLCAKLWRRTSEAASAFEAAAEEAHQYGLCLLEVFAIRDLKLCVLDAMGHAEHASRRLGAALRQLTGPAELLTPMLKGLDAVELMSLPAPEAGYTVLYETEEDGSAAMPPASGDSESASELAEGVPPERAAHVAAKGPDVTGHSQLSGLKLSALKRRAREVGVREKALEEADDADDIKVAVIALILKEEQQQAPA